MIQFRTLIILADEVPGHNRLEGKTMEEVMKRHEEMLNGKTNHTTLNIPQNTTKKGNNTRGLILCRKIVMENKIYYNLVIFLILQLK